MKSKKITIPGIGDVLIQQSRRAKHMNLSVRPFRGVRVAVPRGMSFKSAEEFVRSKTNWILTHLPKMKAMEQAANQFHQHSPIDRKTAREKLVGRLNELSRRHDLPYNRVYVKNQKTRWGSCSEKKNINLNIHLVRLPDELRDYAILHELVHTKQLNHSRKFWRELERQMPGAKALDKQLHSYSFMLMRPSPESPKSPASIDKL